LAFPDAQLLLSTQRHHWLLYQWQKYPVIKLLLLLLLFWQHWGLNSGPHSCKASTLTAWSTPASPFWCWVFWDRVSGTICTVWLQTAILISASWVARITDVNHRPPIQVKKF
jgi:hypothetical protein